MASSDLGFVITPDMKVFKCYFLVDQEEQCLGYIDDVGLKVENYAPLNREIAQGCLECKFLPLCNGGCASSRHYRGLKAHERVCVYSRIEETISLFLPLYIESTYNLPATMTSETASRIEV
jgi:radical SAM protein with 4Fe4S-binding SPASM domain